MAPAKKDTDKPDMPFGSNDLRDALYRFKKLERAQGRKADRTGGTGLVAINRSIHAITKTAIQQLEEEGERLGYGTAVTYWAPLLDADVQAQYEASRARYAATSEKRKAAAAKGAKAKARKAVA